MQEPIFLSQTDKIKYLMSVVCLIQKKVQSFLQISECLEILSTLKCQVVARVSTYIVATQKPFCH